MAISSKIDYRPIACSTYDLFEAAALHRRILELSIEGTTETYLIQEVYSKGKSL